jgi:hypothetical protein
MEERRRMGGGRSSSGIGPREKVFGRREVGLQGNLDPRTTALLFKDKDFGWVVFGFAVFGFAVFGLVVG